jgi:hypothetical protein
LRTPASDFSVGAHAYGNTPVSTLREVNAKYWLEPADRQIRGWPE